ncbi:MFS general substrate transporter [Clavulina sp. PMI_390]|nr:MFS general substrate transporter [Clavulina sp. PMI_390]
MQLSSKASSQGSALEKTTLPTSRRHANGSFSIQTENNEKTPAYADKRETPSKGLSTRDQQAMALLIVLYFIQGIPIGLAFGSIPFLLKSRLSYSQIGIFSLSTYPYSLKLFWSPIVDSVYSKSFGRRKSWIVPIQTIIGIFMLWIGKHAESLLASAEKDITQLTTIFVLMIFFAATQDIAVDGWALNLLSEESLSFASTAQTIGLNTGFFLSFTVFLALNSPEFANKYIRSVPLDTPLVTLGQYLTFSGFFCFAVTLWLVLFKTEEPVSSTEEEMSVAKVYNIMWSICKLTNIQTLCIIHFIAKIGFQANEAVTDLKLVEKGLSKEDLALVVLIDFPFQMIGGWLAGQWSVGEHKLRPWLHGMWIRLGFAVLSMGLVYWFPKSKEVPMSFLLIVIVVKVLSSFAGPQPSSQTALLSTMQFVGISAFHTQISDPVIGGTYMTLLNTVSNLGGTWPRFFVLNGVDWLSVSTCHIKQTTEELLVSASECASESGKERCASLGGTCAIESDGYYTVSAICVAIGAILLVAYIWPAAQRLQRLPNSAWRVNIARKD